MRADVHLTPGCPWYELSELRLPNVDWCEAQRCAWVVEPANAWSNLAYVVVGGLLWWLARDSQSPALRFFGPAAVIVGLCSGIYHSSYTFVLQILDFFGMYVFLYLLIALNLRRLGVLGAGDWWRWFWGLVVATTVLTVGVDFLEIPIQGLIALLIAVVAGSEIWIRRRTAGYSLAAFGGALGLIGAGAVFSALDLSRTWCDPTHPFLQGHAIWHVLSAACLFVVFFHYRQFDKELGV